MVYMYHNGGCGQWFTGYPPWYPPPMRIPPQAVPPERWCGMNNSQQKICLGNLGL
jgi:hypothetical protein